MSEVRRFRNNARLLLFRSDRNDSFLPLYSTGGVELIIGVNVYRYRTSWQAALCGRWDDWCASTYSDDNRSRRRWQEQQQREQEQEQTKNNNKTKNKNKTTMNITYSDDNPALNCCSRFVCKCNLWNSNCRCRSRLFSRRWSWRWESKGHRLPADSTCHGVSRPADRTYLMSL